MALYHMLVLLRTLSRSGAATRSSIPEPGNHRRLGIVAPTGRGNVLDLGSVTTTGDTDTDVEAGELVEADDEQGLVDLDR